MQNLIIEPTETAAEVTPRVDFDAQSGVLEIAGECFPENATQFYQPIFAWLQAYLQETGPSIVFNFRFEAFDVNSSKCILNILEFLQGAHEMGRNIEVNWYYDEDEELLESGQAFAAIVNLPIQLIE